MRSTQPCTATGLTGATGTSMPGNTWPCSVRFEGLDLFETFFKIHFCPSKYCTISEQDSAPGEIKIIMLFSLLLFIDLSSLTPPLHILTHTHTQLILQTTHSWVSFLRSWMRQKREASSRTKSTTWLLFTGKKPACGRFEQYITTHTHTSNYLFLYVW